MTRYILTSARTGNEIDVTYDDQGRLWAVSLNGTYTDIEHRMAWNIMPHTIDLMRALEVRGVNVREVMPDLSFDLFWKTYKGKSGRLRSERVWNRLSDADKMDILISIPKYDKWLLTQPGRARKDPATYLNPSNRYWEDDYSITKAMSR